ncbi:antitoxin family protein [Patescibacteria group bacterium]|nr:antitoxin family protein [Patescibacteria group bacterium]
MKGTIEAIYENEVFKPLNHLDLSEGQHVRLVVEMFTQDKADEMLELAAQVYEGLSDQDVDEIERMALNRREFFREKAF